MSPVENPQIFVIEDHPNQKIGKKSLIAWLTDMLGDKYGVHEPLTDPDPETDNVTSFIENHPEIELVFLDLEFNDIFLGDEIGKLLHTRFPDVRVIVLTHLDEKGKKIKLRQKKNVWKYFVKDDLRDPVERGKLRHLVGALIEDPFNQNWAIQFRREDGTFTLHNPKLGRNGYTAELSFTSQDVLSTLDACLKKPNLPVNIIEIPDASDGFQLPKIVKACNDYIEEEVGWRTWGILDSKRCAANEVRVLIGNVEGENEIEIGVAQELREEIESLKKRLARIEAHLQLGTM